MTHRQSDEQGLLKESDMERRRQGLKLGTRHGILGNRLDKKRYSIFGLLGDSWGFR